MFWSYGCVLAPLARQPEHFVGIFGSVALILRQLAFHEQMIETVRGRLRRMLNAAIRVVQRAHGSPTLLFGNAGFAVVEGRLKSVALHFDRSNIEAYGASAESTITRDSLAVFNILQVLEHVGDTLGHIER